jgi:crossover junction endodeoxyribonuclease RuvC
MSDTGRYRKRGVDAKRPGTSSAVSVSAPRVARPEGIYIGIDPGLASVGYGVLRVVGARLTHIDHGVITTSAGEESGARLLAIFDAISELLRGYSPIAGGMEALYFSRNISSALPVSEAKGVIRLAFARSGVGIKEYSPVALKLGVVGDGRAEKEQVQEMVRVILGLQAIPKPDHAADALAAAICRANDFSSFT